MLCMSSWPHTVRCGRDRSLVVAAQEGAPVPSSQGAVELIEDVEDPRLAIYRARSRRDTELYNEHALQLASEALWDAGLVDEAERQRLYGGPRKRRELRHIDCVVSVHYSWDCAKQLIAWRASAGGLARPAGGLLVGSALLPTGTPEEFVAMATSFAPKTYLVDRSIYESEFGQDIVWKGSGSDPSEPAAEGDEGSASSSKRSWRRYEGGACQSTIRYAVAGPVTTPLRQMQPPFIVLDNLTSASNVGQILRTAYHLGVTSVVASRASWNSLNGRACRVSMGWLYFMQFHLADPLPDALVEMKQLGIRIYAAENQFAKPVAPHEPHGDKSWALIVGHEGLGISAEAVELSDACVTVQQQQGQSLNVSHAASICLYELSKHHIVQQSD